jgi:hypothetical protein
MSAIRTQKLSKRYGDTLALDSLDLDVKEGEVYGYRNRRHRLGPAVLVGPTFYARRRLGAYMWRKLHRRNGCRLGALGRPRARRRIRLLEAAAPMCCARSGPTDRHVLVLRAVPPGADKFGAVLLRHVLRAEQTSGH